MVAKEPFPEAKVPVPAPHSYASLTSPASARAVVPVAVALPEVVAVPPSLDPAFKITLACASTLRPAKGRGRRSKAGGGASLPGQGSCGVLSLVLQQEEATPKGEPPPIGALL